MKLSQFYCINCGRYVIDLPRNQSKLHKAGHLKRLYCPYCKLECNCYECPSEADVYNFKEAYSAGEFVELAIESIEHCQGGKK